jgi:hypothetical protein
VAHALDFARAEGAGRVLVALIDEHGKLKKWYENLGFAETGRKHFPHFPFAVCFME